MRFRAYTGIIFHDVEDCEEQLSVQWRTHDCDNLSRCDCGDFYLSPEFSFGKACWRLRMASNGETRNPPFGCLGLFLMRTDKGPPVTVQFTLGVERSIKRKAKQEFLDNTYSFGWYEFLPRSELPDLLPNVTQFYLTILCRMKIVLPSPTKGISSHPGSTSQTDGKFDEPSTSGSQMLNNHDESIQMNEELKEAEDLTDDSHSSEKQGIEKVVEDLGKLLVSSENSDVTVQVGDTEFSVHRAILTARCPVLSAMFQHQTVQKASNKINVEDCEPDVFKDFLQYLYTGAVQSLTGQNVFAVYRVADKYLAGDLKLECLKHIQKTLCVQTFCDAVKLAVTHSETDLLQLAIDFAIKNIQQIVCSVEWQNFICEHPREANEILIKCLVPKS